MGVVKLTKHFHLLELYLHSPYGLFLTTCLGYSGTTQCNYVCWTSEYGVFTP